MVLAPTKAKVGRPRKDPKKRKTTLGLSVPQWFFDMVQELNDDVYSNYWKLLWNQKWNGSLEVIHRFMAYEKLKELLDETLDYVPPEKKSEIESKIPTSPLKRLKEFDDNQDIYLDPTIQL